MQNMISSILFVHCFALEINNNNKNAKRGSDKRCIGNYLGAGAYVPSLLNIFVGGIDRLIAMLSLASIYWRQTRNTEARVM